MLRSPMAWLYSTTFYCHYHANELHQQSVARDANDTTVVLRYFRLNKFAKVCLPLGERALLVCADTAAKTSHIGGEKGQ